MPYLVRADSDDPCVGRNIKKQEAGAKGIRAMNDRSDGVREFYEDSLFVTHSICNASDFIMPKLHFHDGFEIYFTLSDHTIFFNENRTYCLQRGGMVLINNNELHRSSAPSGGIYERYIVSFVPDYIAELNHICEEDLFHAFTNRPQDFTGSVQLTETQTEDFICQLELLKHYIEDDVYCKEMHKKLQLARIVLLCNEYFSSNSGTNLSVHFTERLRPILMYIKQHPDADLSLERLSSDFYISKSHLIRLFKVATGMTPNAYIVMTRVMKSREYLIAGMPIVKICELIGYADESHFIRTFKKVLGITPKQYSLLKKRERQ